MREEYFHRTDSRGILWGYLPDEPMDVKRLFEKLRAIFGEPTVTDELVIFFKYDKDTIYDHKFHICWITKYRYQVLRGEIGERTRDLIKQICKEYGVEIIQGHVRPEHVHILVSVPPQLSISKLMQYIKGKSGRKLLQEYEMLRKRYYGGHIWSRGYYSATSGNVTDEMIVKYVHDQDRLNEEDDNFLVSG